MLERGRPRETSETIQTGAIFTKGDLACLREVLGNRVPVVGDASGDKQTGYVLQGGRLYEIPMEKPEPGLSPRNHGYGNLSEARLFSETLRQQEAPSKEPRE